MWELEGPEGQASRKGRSEEVRPVSGQSHRTWGTQSSFLMEVATGKMSLRFKVRKGGGQGTGVTHRTEPG